MRRRATRRVGRPGPSLIRPGVAAALAVGLLGTLGVLAASGGPQASPGRTAAAPVGPGLALAGTVVVRDLPARPSAGHPAQHKPFLSPRLQTPAASAPAHGTVVVDDAGPLKGSRAPASAGPNAATLSIATPTVTTAFPGWSSSQSQATFKQFWTPPDPQVAAGPAISGSPTCASGCLMELVNDVGSIWSKSGQIETSFDLNTFFKVPSGQTYSDPRVVFDAPSGRWFATGLSFTSSYGSQIYIAVSSTGDPSGLWTVYNGDFSSTVLHDQPKIGLSADKVLMAWNDVLRGTSFPGSA